MAISRLFRDIIFVRAGRLQINGLYRKLHINARICNLCFWDAEQMRNRHIFLALGPLCIILRYVFMYVLDLGPAICHRR